MSSQYRVVVLFALLGAAWLVLAWADHVWLRGASLERLLAVDLLGLVLFLGLAVAIARTQVRRERASAEAQAQAALLRALMAAIPDELYLTDPDGHITAASVSFAQRVGSSPEDLVGKPLAELLPADQAGPLSAADRQVLDSGAVQTGFELTVLGPDGAPRTWETSAAPLLGSDGAARGVARSSRDVTARAQMLAALQASEERFSGLFNALGDAVMIHDLEGHIIEINDAACRRLGYMRDELLGMSPADLEADQRAARFARRLAQVEETGHALSQTEHRRRDGTAIPTELSSTLLHYDGGPAILSVARDVTERRVAEHRLTHLNTVLRALRRVNQLVTQAGTAEELLQGVCDVLVQTRGYGSVWIARYDDQGAPAGLFGTAPGAPMRALAARFEDGRLPHCVRACVETGELQVIHDAEATCGDCPLARVYGAADSLAAPLRHGDRVYGMIAASLPAALSADPREISLFRDLCSDIAFGLRAARMRRRAPVASAIYACQRP